VLLLYRVTTWGSPLSCLTTTYSWFGHFQGGFGNSAESWSYLHYQGYRKKLSDCLANLEQYKQENSHFEFFWFPYTDGVRAKFMNETTEPPSIADCTGPTSSQPHSLRPGCLGITWSGYDVYPAP
jgi:hypothetical protein